MKTIKYKTILFILIIQLFLTNLYGNQSIQKNFGNSTISIENCNYRKEFIPIISSCFTKKPRCEKFNVTNIITINDESEYNLDSTGKLLDGTIFEQWYVNACDLNYVFNVTISIDNKTKNHSYMFYLHSNSTNNKILYNKHEYDQNFSDTTPPLISEYNIFYVSRPPTPRYPDYAKINNIESETIFEVIIDENGTPINTTMLWGPNIFKTIMIEYLNKCKFRKITIDSKPIKSRFRIIIPFKLNNNEILKSVPVKYRY